MSTANEPMMRARRPATGDEIWELARWTLERDGHAVVVSREDLDLLPSDGRNCPLVVVAADRADRRWTAQLLRRVEALQPGAGSILVHDADDVASASVALRQGARSCMRPLVNDADDDADVCDPAELAQQLVQRLADIADAPAVTDELTAEAIAQHALELAAEDRVVEAIGELCLVDGVDPMLAAVEHLTDACVAVLNRVPDRTRFPISLDYVIERLAIPSEDDTGLCYAFLHRAAFRNAGFDVDVHRLTSIYGHRGVLFAAFHSTRAVLQFVSERWWRTPISVLDDLDVSGAGA